MMRSVDPVLDIPAATRLGAALRRLGYTEDAVDDLLDDEDVENPVVGERRLPRNGLGTAIRVFFLQLPVSKRDAVRAFGRDAVDALAATGLADVGGEVVPRVRIIPIGSLLVASDDFPEGDDESPPEYVAAYTPTSRLCDCLTPRRRVARALDIGTGSGVQALLAARHAKHVVATDVNERALAYTQINAALNGLTNVECRRGSLFEPVAGEQFDLITSNAPYVVSPENRWIFRDAGFEGDGLSERIVHEASEHLAEGGYATLLVSWIAEDQDEPDERPLAWTEAAGCDSWILPIWEADALAHAATWNDYISKPSELRAALDTWIEYLDRIDAHWISEGAILLHRRDDGSQTIRVDQVDEDDIEPASDQIQRAFAARARLTELRPRSELLDARLAVAAPLRLEREITPGRGRDRNPRAWLELDEGTHAVVDGPLAALELIGSLDGTRSLGELASTPELQRAVLPIARELLELGALSFSG
jgi:methylase of polypeptide subunit release factors